MTRKMVFIDLDRTLINEDYQLTDDSLVEVIKEKRQEGWEIGLSSDTPMPTLFWWWSQLGMNGPIIVEKGASAWFPEDDAETVFTGSRRIVVSSKQDILSTLSRVSGTMLLHGDATAFIRGTRKLPGVLDSTLVAYNGLRQYSIGFFVRRIGRDGGELLIDNELAQDVIHQVREHLPHSDLLTEGVLDPEFGFFYVNPADVSKGSSALQVFEACKVTRRVVIGDSMSDFVEGGGVEICAVGNAYNDFKKKAQIVAVRSYTAGVREILAQL